MGIEHQDDEQQEQAIDLNQIVADEAVAVNEEVEQQEEVNEMSPLEQQAFDQGWRPQDDFKGDQDNWKTPKEFIKDGEWLAKLKEKDQRIDRIEENFNKQIADTNKLHEARRQAEIKKLKVDQRDAVDAADTEAYDKAQEQIAELEKAPEQVEQQPVKDVAVTEWEAKNPWINDSNDEKTPVAQAIWNSYLQKNKGATTQEALAHVDDRISKLYPANNSNPRRDQPNTTETPRKVSRKGKALTMGDLTNDERQEWTMYGAQIFKTESAFLKAVVNARKK